MVLGVVPECPLKWIPGKLVSAVIIDSLEGTEREEEEASLLTHAGELECETSTDCVHEESFKRVVVESPECIGAVEAVVM